MPGEEEEWDNQAAAVLASWPVGPLVVQQFSKRGIGRDNERHFVGACPVAMVPQG